MAHHSGLSNIRSTQVKKPTKATVIDDLTELSAKLKRAQARKDPGAITMCRHDIDVALERLLGVASEAEYGAGGMAPT